VSEEATTSGVARVRQALSDAGIQTIVMEMPASTRTAKEAAAVIGCSVAAIAKSLVFRGVITDRAVLVIASGANRVHEETVARLLGEPIERANPEFVRTATGYAIGGVPPVAHMHILPVWIDRDLFQFEHVWAAAGTPFAVFSVRPDDLKRATGGEVADLRS